MRETLISEEYRQLNIQYHAENDWGLSGKKYYKPFYNFAKKLNAETILDYGCGSGTLRKAFIGHKTLDEFKVFDEYDPAIAGKDKPQGKTYDVVSCTDVMEHVEPEFIDATIKHLWGLAGRGLFLVIATGSSSEWLADGTNAHRTVNTAAQWLARIEGVLGIKVTSANVEPKKVYVFIDKTLKPKYLYKG